MKKKSSKSFSTRKKNLLNSAGNKIGGVGGKGQPRRYNVSIEEIIKALEAKQGLISLAAKSLRITHQALDKRIRQSKELQEAINFINESNLDLSESTLYTMIQKKNLGAICFHLKCKGKHRGWVERQEVAGVKDQPIKFIVEYVEAKNAGNEDPSPKHD